MKSLQLLLLSLFSNQYSSGVGHYYIILYYYFLLLLDEMMIIYDEERRRREEAFFVHGQHNHISGMIGALTFFLNLSSKFYMFMPEGKYS